MSKTRVFRSQIISLWLRVVGLALIGLVFAEALYLGKAKIQGWSFYLTSSELVFETAVRLVFTALLGIALGTLVSVLIVGAMGLFKTRRAQIAEYAVKVGVLIVVFVCSNLALTALIKWSYQIAEHRGIFDMALRGAFYLAFVLALCFPKPREGLLTSLDAFLTDSFTRRAIVATIALAVGIAVLGFALDRSNSPVRASAVSQRPKSNILLITFDALSADDMSTYGYQLPTTPNIDAFANKATLFTNYYSASTFTTPCVATMLTGMYPSQTIIYQLQGKLKDPEKTLPQLFRDGGYTSASFFSNPYAYYLAKSVESKFDLLPEPIFEGGGLQRLWGWSKPLHQGIRFGSRIEEYVDLVIAWNRIVGLPDNSHETFHAAESFRQGRVLLSTLPDGFFLWIHVMTPHGPYLPDPKDRGRFLPANIRQVYQGEGKPDWKPHYAPDQQSEVDEWHLRYDEFTLTADRAFGEFISEFDKSGKSANTIVIVSADHGESFTGGVFQHGNVYQTRPVLHIPLIIRTAGQQASHRVAFTADQTALPPTILDLAGLPKPPWMQGPSLVGWLNPESDGQNQGLAFTQYFEKNSIFKPLHHGTVGVIDGKDQYVLNLDNGKGWLRPLEQAQNWKLDLTAANPQGAQDLRNAIYAKFPELRSSSQ